MPRAVLSPKVLRSSLGGDALTLLLAGLTQESYMGLSHQWCVQNGGGGLFSSTAGSFRALGWFGAAFIPGVSGLLRISPALKLFNSQNGYPSTQDCPWLSNEAQSPCT